MRCNNSSQNQPSYYFFTSLPGGLAYIMHASYGLYYICSYFDYNNVATDLVNVFGCRYTSYICLHSSAHTCGFTPLRYRKTACRHVLREDHTGKAYP